jgi:hypothetical protein
MIRFRLRTFVIGCGVFGAVVGLLLENRWRPHIGSRHEQCGGTFDPCRYQVTWIRQWRPFGRERLVCIRVTPKNRQLNFVEWNVTQKGVFFRGELAERGKVYFVHEDGALVLPIKAEDFDELEQVASDWFKLPGIPRDLTSKEAAQWRAERAKFSPANSEVWKTKIEPQILKLIEEHNLAREPERHQMRNG